MKTLRRNLWVGALAMGLFFMVNGGLLVYMGNDAKNMITDELVTQNITLGADAVEFGGTPGDAIRDARTADIESKIITLHAEGKHGVWSAQDRKTEEGLAGRASITSSLPLRNSLNMAVMGYGIANLAMGVGAMIILMGAGTMAFLAPVLYLAIAKEEEPKAATLALAY
ncbi:MAG TPA: hypothetical protein EYQ67_09355 [Dehalococcoidia bacterium]|nr:hypothetical protein [Dehalococcoidia bacterium]